MCSYFEKKKEKLLIKLFTLKIIDKHFWGPGNFSWFLKLYPYLMILVYLCFLLFLHEFSKMFVIFLHVSREYLILGCQSPVGSEFAKTVFLSWKIYQNTKTHTYTLFYI